MLIVWLAVAGMLVLVASVRPSMPTVSGFELRRRADAGDHGAATSLRRVRLLGDVLSLRRALGALLLVSLTLLGVAVFGWWRAVLIMLVVALWYGTVARLPVVHRLAQRLYGQYEHRLLDWLEEHPVVTRLFHSDVAPSLGRSHADSREELRHMIENTAAIPPLEKTRLTAGMRFVDTRVRDVMTPREEIASIAKGELLGPLVLDDLHKTGHGCFPVIDGDLDRIVGLLSIRELLELGTKRSVTAEKAMVPQVCYLREDQPLEQALAGFLQTKQRLFVVINSAGRTVGLLSLQDVAECLLGYRTTDAFDAYGSIQSVAARPHDLEA